MISTLVVSPGGQLFPGWGHSAACGRFHVLMPGQMSSAQGHIDDPRPECSFISYQEVR